MIRQDEPRRVEQIAGNPVYGPQGTPRRAAK